MMTVLGTEPFLGVKTWTVENFGEEEETLWKRMNDIHLFKVGQRREKKCF